MEPVVQQTAQNLIGEYGWLFIAGIVTILFKGLIASSASAAGIYFSKQYQPDDIIFIAGRKARIFRIGLRDTTVYYPDTSTRVVIPNEKIRGMGIEKEVEPFSPVKTK